MQRMQLRKNRGLSSDQKRRLLELGLSPLSKAGLPPSNAGSGSDGDIGNCETGSNPVMDGMRLHIDENNNSKPGAVELGKKLDGSGSTTTSGETVKTSQLLGTSSARLKQWHSKFKQLTEFKEKNGHCKCRQARNNHGLFAV